MRIPYFITLTQVDQEHYIAACRHGMVHLTWGRTTVRFSRDEFRRLAELLQLAADSPPPASLRDRELRITARLDEDCELQFGALVLLLPLEEFRNLARAAEEAVQRLDEVLTSGAWQSEPEGSRMSFLEQLRRSSFSKN